MSQTSTISKFFSMLGILGYLLSDIFAVIFFQILTKETIDWQEGLGNIIAAVIVIVYVMIISSVATLFILLGKIWTQNRPLVVASLLTFGVNAAAIVVLTLQADQLNSSIIGLWAVIVGILLIHLNGLR